MIILTIAGDEKSIDVVDECGALEYEDEEVEEEIVPPVLPPVKQVQKGGFELFTPPKAVPAASSGKMRLTPEQKDRLVTMLEEGKRDIEIAAKIGCSSATVYNYRRKLGIANPKKSDVKLTPAIRERILDSRDMGKRIPEIAKLEGLDEDVVKKVIAEDGV